MKKQAKKILCLCLATMLVFSILPVGPAYADSMLELQAESSNPAQGICVSDLCITNLSIPKPDQPFATTATVVTAEGFSWEIPVIWLDENGEIAEGIAGYGRYIPVFVFFIPEGYYVKAVNGVFTIRLDDALSALFGSRRLVSVYSSDSGITYIFPESTDQSFLLKIKEKEKRQQFIDIPDSQPDDDGNSTPEEPPPAEDERRLIDIYCSKNTQDFVDETSLLTLVKNIVYVLEPQAVNLLLEKFPAFKKAAENGELGQSIGLYIYFQEGDSDGIKAHEKVPKNARAFVSDHIWKDEDDVYHYGYLIGVDASNFAETDENGNPVTDSSSGLIKLKEYSPELENTLVHEMMHAFMNDYNRVGMSGVTTPEEFPWLYSEQEFYAYDDYDPDKLAEYYSYFVKTYLPRWFIEGLATTVERNYISRGYAFELLRYNDDWTPDISDGTKRLNDEYTTEAMKAAYTREYFYTSDTSVNFNFTNYIFDIEKAGLFTTDAAHIPSKYASGYLASLYLAELAAKKGSETDSSVPDHGVDSFNNERFLYGVNYILEKMHDGDPLDYVISDISNNTYTDTQNFEQKFIKGIKEGDQYTGDEDSLNFCVSFLNYLLKISQTEGRTYLPTGSILFPFEDDYETPLFHVAPAEKTMYQIIESSNFVESTVDRWKDGGTTITGREEWIGDPGDPGPVAILPEEGLSMPDADAEPGSDSDMTKSTPEAQTPDSPEDSDVDTPQGEPGEDMLADEKEADTEKSECGEDVLPGEEEAETAQDEPGASMPPSDEKADSASVSGETETVSDASEASDSADASDHAAAPEPASKTATPPASEAPVETSIPVSSAAPAETSAPAASATPAEAPSPAAPAAPAEASVPAASATSAESAAPAASETPAATSEPEAPAETPPPAASEESSETEPVCD